MAVNTDHIKKIISRLEQEIALRDEQVQRLVTGLNKVYASLSWKITAPVRKIHSALTGSKYTPFDPLAYKMAGQKIVVPADLFETENKEKAEGEFIFEQVETAELERRTMQDFFVFPIIDWDFRFQRPQQLASRLASQGNRVFYFKTTFNSFTGALSNRNITIENPRENIYIVKLATRDRINIYRDFVHGRPPMEDILAGISLLKRKFAIIHSVSIIDHPFWWPVARMLKNNLNVYDCMDEHSGFDNNNNTPVYEPALIADASLVTVSSDILYDKISVKNANVVQVKNGTDFAHFSELPDADVLQNITKPVIGYYGAIAEWFDTDLVEKCAKAYPDYHFVLIGRVTNKDIPRLENFPNVTLTGEIPYKELPGYLKKFKVCLIPFVITKLIEATNPVKFYEYISSGKPVVSVALPELKPHRDLCYLAENHDAFIKNIKLAVDENDAELIKKRIETAMKNSWDHRAEAFTGAINKLYPRVSVIIVTYNNLPYTRACFESVIQYSRYPNMELIFIDNGSDGETLDFIEKTEKEHPFVQVVINKENRGFAAANNQGMALATGEYIVYLNNDTIVTNNWIESLITHFRINRSIGLLCPVTNATGNEACVKKGYDRLEDLQQFAFQLAQDKGKSIMELRCVPLYCAMIRTGLARQIGGLNEEYAKGMFEDDELSARVRQAGYLTACAEDVFVHHFGRASFKIMPKAEYDELFMRNRAIFENKWGPWVPHIRGWFNTEMELPDV